MAESSLAADLLADFNDDSDNEEALDIENGDLDAFDTNARRTKARELSPDGDDEEDEDEDGDREMGGAPRIWSGTKGPKYLKSELADDDDEEARKAKVEKMRLGGVDDIRSVAGLMKVLEPVLEVHNHPALFPAPEDLLTLSETANPILPKPPPVERSSGECRRQPGVQTARPIQCPRCLD